jgi:hypothetical protein
LADWSLPRRRDTVEVIGAALLAHTRGEAHRPIAERLDGPGHRTRMVASARSIVEQLPVLATVLAHDFDPELAPITPTGLPDR